MKNKEIENINKQLKLLTDNQAILNIQLTNLTEYVESLEKLIRINCDHTDKLKERIDKFENKNKCSCSCDKQ